MAASTLYIHLIFHGINLASAECIHQLIKSTLPQAVVIGMPETLFATSDGVERLIISVNYFLKSEVKLLQLPGLPSDYELDGKKWGK